MHDKTIKKYSGDLMIAMKYKPFGKLCLYGFGRTPNLIVIMTPM